MRKFFTVVFSVLWFQNPWSWQHSVGAFFVFGGGFLYSSGEMIATPLLLFWYRTVLGKTIRARTSSSTDIDDDEEVEEQKKAGSGSAKKSSSNSNEGVVETGELRERATKSS